MSSPARRIAIVGCRDFEDWEKFSEKLAHIIPMGAREIISGGAPGTDKMAKQYAIRYAYIYTEFPADWETYGKSAGPRRNKQIVDYADMVVAFWDGKSPGTKSTIEFAKKVNKELIVINI